MALRTNEEHRDAVSARLREYETALDKRTFEMLDFCDICNTVKETGSLKGGGCWHCMFYSRKDSTTCRDEATDRYGAQCANRAQLRTHFKYLLGQLDKNGYEFR